VRTTRGGHHREHHEREAREARGDQRAAHFAVSRLLSHPTPIVAHAGHAPAWDQRTSGRAARQRRGLARTGEHAQYSTHRCSARRHSSSHDARLLSPAPILSPIVVPLSDSHVYQIGQRPRFVGKKNKKGGAARTGRDFSAFFSAIFQRSMREGRSGSGGLAPALLALSLLALPTCSPLPTPSCGLGGGAAVPDARGRRGLGWAPAPAPRRAPHELVALRGGSMPGFGLNTDLIDKLMTPDMIRGAANMMSNMDPGVLSSMMSMTGMPPDFDPAEAQRAAAELRGMSTDEIQAMKSSAFSAPFPGGPVSARGVRMCWRAAPSSRRLHPALPVLRALLGQRCPGADGSDIMVPICRAPVVGSLGPRQMVTDVRSGKPTSAWRAPGLVRTGYRAGGVRGLQEGLEVSECAETNTHATMA